MWGPFSTTGTFRPYNTLLLHSLSNRTGPSHIALAMYEKLPLINRRQDVIGADISRSSYSGVHFHRRGIFFTLVILLLGVKVFFFYPWLKVLIGSPPLQHESLSQSASQFDWMKVSVHFIVLGSMTVSHPPRIAALILLVR